MLAVTKISTPAICVGARSASQTPPAAFSASPAGSSDSTSAANSSPPILATVTVGGKATRSLEPTS